MELQPSILVIVDISGYTRFIRLNRVAVMHAETIISELLEAVTVTSKFPLRINRLEGDSVFLFCPVSEADMRIAVSDVATQITAMIAAFDTAMDHIMARSEGGCICDACCHLEQLDIKAFAHFGETVIKDVDGHQELGGEPPIIIHRMTKNNIDNDRYVMLTTDFADHLEGELYPDRKAGAERYDQIGDVPYVVYFPVRAGQQRPIVPRLSTFHGIREAIRLFATGLATASGRRRKEFKNIPYDR